MGFGGMDLFMSSRNPDGTWGAPRNLGYPLNTGNDERTLFITTDGYEGYFNSDREGGLGKIDLYVFEVDSTIRPQRATFVRGLVLDSLSRQFVGGARLVFQDLASGDTIRSLRSAAATGKFLVSLPLGRDYAAFVEAEGYLFHSHNFSLRNVGGQAYFDLNIELNKLKVNTIVRLENIFFDYDKASLKTESRLELSKLLDFLQKNPTVSIEVRGHTDSQGSDTYNLTLSQQRAEAVREYLIINNISPARVTAKGFGETQPIAPNDTEAGRAQNRRTEFRIVSVSH
jgi:outer membrane protein OmpA-like peptidoglycan-associated protein